jgi:hypothetical protein
VLFQTTLVDLLNKGSTARGQQSAHPSRGPICASDPIALSVISIATASRLLEEISVEIESAGEVLAWRPKSGLMFFRCRRTGEAVLMATVGAARSAGCPAQNRRRGI